MSNAWFARRPPAVTEEPAICPGCGVLALPGAPSCATCRTAYGSPPLHASSQPNGGYWVALRASFTCRACDFDSPLSHFPFGDGVVCVHCGIEQRFPTSRWRPLVDFAHEVGDFGSSGPQGRFMDARRPVSNPHPALGVTASWATMGDTERAKCSAAPGNPLCRRCKAPIVVVSEAGGVLEVRCSKCGEEGRYELPPTAREIDGLSGVLADEHAAGAREAVVEESSGVTMLICPGCAAPLKGVDEGATVVTCAYCGVVCRITSPAHAGAGAGEARVPIWWLYFDQPSRRRLDLTRQRKTAARRGETRDAAPAPGPAAPPPSELASRAESGRPARWWLLAMPLAVAGLTAVALLGKRPWHGSDEATTRSDASLQRFGFDMSADDMGALFGVSPSQDLTVDFAPGSAIRRAKIETGGYGNYWRIRLLSGDAFDADATLRRLEQLVPNRLTATEKGAAYAVETNESSLHFTARPSAGDRPWIYVDNYVGKTPRQKERARAFWAVARFAIYGEPEPTPEALLLVNGAPLSDLSKLDLKVDAARALRARVYTEIFPDAECKVRSVTNLESWVRCSFQVNSPIAREAHLEWAEEKGTHIRQADFDLNTERALGAVDPATVDACLDRALGAEHQVAVVMGGPQSEWRLEPAGDVVTRHDRSVRVRASTKTPSSEVPAWTTRYAAIVEALESCSR